jgi:signal transduction histidine kinase
VVLDQLGLAPAIEALCRRARAGIGTPDVDCIVDLPQGSDGRPVRFDAEAEMCVYRVVQEALSNALRYSGARQIGVTVRLAGAYLVAEVTDDGRGMGFGRSSGLGLPGMQERASLAGGRACDRVGAATWRTC